MRQEFWVIEKLKKEIQKRGGFVNCHAHFDKAFTVEKNNIRLANATMEEKWKFYKRLDYRIYYKRIEKSIKLMINQGIKQCRTDIDVN
ncbi:MAG: hypothetical protein GF347_00245, partial [Candidatus Moranbacteria bacterium]|nr:hypothetical protein [Candidatus Moranbacteria bacterium]